jgi:uncharacterized protein YdcH (DUF465 family)
MARKLVTLEERQWLAQNAVRMMGKNVQYPVLDIDKAVARIQDQRKNQSLSPWIEIQPISEDMHKVPNRVATFQKDPITGVYYGIVLDQDEFGNLRWQKLQLHDNISLNMDRISDAKIWAVLRFHPDIQGSPWQVQNPYYKIFDPIDEARAEGKEIEMMKKAFDRVDILLDNPKNMVFFARYLGEELVENSNFELVRGALLRFAKNAPTDFNKKWENRLRSFGEHFESAKALGIITNDADRGFMFRNIALGINPEEAIRTLSQDSNIMNSINNELAEKDQVIIQIQEELEKEQKEEVKGKKKEKVPAGSVDDDFS